jgi:muramidase (phage lysozyme)
MMPTNRKAMLDTIAFSEGTSTSPATDNDGYDVIVTGEDGVYEIFTDYADHPFAPSLKWPKGRPPKVISTLHGINSTASGRYQQMLHWWAPYKKQLGLKDFGPESQDLLAIQLIRECHALPLIDMGSFQTAILACSSR